MAPELADARLSVEPGRASARTPRVVVLGCGAHPARPSVVSCAVCLARLCDDCHRFVADGAPWCARCVNEIETRPRRRVSLAVAFVGLAAGVGALFVRHGPLTTGEEVWLAVAAVVVAGIAVAAAYSGVASKAPRIARRDGAATPDVELSQPTRGSPYRARLRRAVHALSPRVSAKAVVAVLLSSFAFVAAALPMALGFSRWVEIEVVLFAWWIGLAATLGVLLYRGFRLDDDWRYYGPFDWRAARNREAPNKRGDLAPVGCATHLLGELWALAVLAALLFGAAWLLVELLLPLAFLFAYTLLLYVLGGVATDQHGCRGRLGRAAGWGAARAALWIAPLAALAAAVARIAR